MRHRVGVAARAPSGAARNARCQYVTVPGGSAVGAVICPRRASLGRTPPGDLGNPGMVSVWAGWGDREEGLVGTGWNRLEPAVVPPASPPSSLSLRTESPWGSAAPPALSRPGRAGPGTGTGSAVLVVPGAQPQALWVAVRPRPLSPDGAVTTRRSSGTIVTPSAGLCRGGAAV